MTVSEALGTQGTILVLPAIFALAGISSESVESRWGKAGCWVIVLACIGSFIAAGWTSVDYP